jgi:cell division protein FtsB
VKDAASHFRPAPPGGFLPRLNKILLALIVATAVIPLTLRALPGRSEKTAQDKMIATAESDLAEANMIKDRLTREVTLLMNDGEYLGLFARDKVGRGYMKAGETIFRLAPRQQ